MSLIGRSTEANYMFGSLWLFFLFFFISCFCYLRRAKSKGIFKRAFVFDCFSFFFLMNCAESRAYHFFFLRSWFLSVFFFIQILFFHPRFSFPFPFLVSFLFASISFFSTTISLVPVCFVRLYFLLSCFQRPHLLGRIFVETKRLLRSCKLFLLVCVGVFVDPLVHFSSFYHPVCNYARKEGKNHTKKKHLNVKERRKPRVLEL